MGSPFNGTWVCTKNENFDEFLKEIGQGMVARKMAKSLTTTLDIKSTDGKTFTVKSSTGPKTRENTFDIGKEIQESSSLGKPMKGSWTFDQSDMVGEFKAEDNSGAVFKIRRTIKDGQLIQKMQIGSTECTRYFAKK